MVFLFDILIDFSSSVRKLIGSKSSSPPVVAQTANGSSRPSVSTTKLSGYFQRSSSATSSGFCRVSREDQELAKSAKLGGSRIGLNQAALPSPSVLPSDLCPSCLMPFDKNRKRRLIDSCGHERCYACLFSSEVCPLCSPGRRHISSSDGPFLDTGSAMSPGLVSQTVADGCKKKSDLHIGTIGNGTSLIVWPWQRGECR